MSHIENQGNKALSSLSKALASEEKEAAALRKLAEVKEEMKRKEKESKERETELFAFQTDYMEQMRKMRQEMLELKGMGQPVVMERPKATANDQSEVQKK